MPAMLLTERDMHNLGVEGGWSAKRPRLTPDEMEDLLDLIKRPFPEDKRDRAHDWLNEIYARFVALARDRAAVGPGPSASPSLKISTAVHRDLTKLVLAIDRATKRLEGFEIATYVVVQSYLRHTGSHSNTCLRLKETLHESWGNGFNALRSFEVACERHEETKVGAI